MKNYFLILIAVIGLFIAGCATEGKPSQFTEPGNQLSFVDIGKFDSDLAACLNDKNEAVSVSFYEKVSPNQMPERLQKWISSVEQSGGRVRVDPPQGEVAPKDPFTIIGLIASMIGGAKNFAEFRTNKTYDVAKDRNAVISLERNSKGDVVVYKIQFIKRTSNDSEKK